MKALYTNLGRYQLNLTVKGVSSSIYEGSVVVYEGSKFNFSKIQETLDNIKKVSVSNGYPFFVGKVEYDKKL